jgi:hypothetical protein
MEVHGQIIRLIVDNKEENIGVAVGLTKERTKQIKKEIAQLYTDHHTVSKRMEVATQTYYHPAELAFALLTIGEYMAKSNCPLHMKGGGIGFIIGGSTSPFDDGD